MKTSRHSLSTIRHGPAQRRDLPHERVDRPLVGFARDYPDGDTVPRHIHGRAQLLYATQGVMRIATDAAEYALEATWRIPLGEHFALQPDLQYVIHPGTDPTLDDALVFILRVEAGL